MKLRRAGRERCLLSCIEEVKHAGDWGWRGDDANAAVQRIAPSHVGVVTLLTEAVVDIPPSPAVAHCRERVCRYDVDKRPGWGRGTR